MVSNLKEIVTDLSQLKRADETILQDEENVNNVTKYLKEILREREDIFAICAPQIGISERIICIRFANENIKTFINPLLQKTEGVHLSRERDICFPDKEYLLPRFNKIEVSYQDTSGSISTVVLTDAASEVMQQMIQFIDGVTIADWGLEIIPEFDEATQEERDEVVNLYLEGLGVTAKVIHDKAETDKDFKELLDAIDFINFKIKEAEKEQEQLAISPKGNYRQRREIKKLQKRLKKKGSKK